MYAYVKLYKYKWQRFPGDNVIYQELENWYKRERHLYEYEANLRDQIIARRNEEYRKFAAGVVRKYGYVVLELFDLAEMAKKPMPDQGVKTSLPPNKYRFIAAPSELRNAIENACKREGILVERVNPDYTTQECHLCGFTKKFDAAANIVHTCPGCNNKWDQDYNAAVVLLKRKLGYHVVAPTATI